MREMPGNTCAADWRWIGPRKLPANCKRRSAALPVGRQHRIRAGTIENVWDQSQNCSNGEAVTTFTTSREIPATVEEVFAAISRPERLSRWWGPAGFTNTFNVCEFQIGGCWSFVMHGPDGRKFPNENVFADIEPPGKVVIEHACEPRYCLTITLLPLGVRTIVCWSQQFDNSEVARRLEKIVVPPPTSRTWSAFKSRFCRYRARAANLPQWAGLTGRH